MDTKRPIVIGAGELLWDLFPSGRQLGGAPANFTFQAQQLGARGYIVSAVGKDGYGDEIMELLCKKGMDINFVGQIDKMPTGTVAVGLDADGVPVYSIQEGVAWDHIPFDPPAMEILHNASAFCFGTLAQRSAGSMSTIRRSLQMLPSSCLVVFDINLRQRYFTTELIETSLEYADVLKLNEDELAVVSELLGLDGPEESRLASLLKTYHLRLIALTKGAYGSLLYMAEETSWCDTPKVHVADTVGAGDAFTAAMVVSILNGLPLREVHQNAVDVSAFVASQAGGMPDLSAAVLDRFISKN